MRELKGLVMAKQPPDAIRLQVRYHGTGPLVWSGGPRDFGVQDKAGVLHPGRTEPDGAVAFELSLQVKPDGAGAPVFLGPFAHGRPDDRFLYLGWRNADGGFAQRLKLPLGSIGWSEVHRAVRTGDALAGELLDRSPRITSTGANIGGSRAVAWKFP